MSRTPFVTESGRSARRMSTARRGLLGRLVASAAGIAAAAALSVAPASAQSSGSSVPLETFAPLVQATGSGASEPAQRAPEGGARLVTIGDSTMAGTNLPFVDGGRGCFRSPNRFVAQIARDIGVYNTADFQDTSCWGATLDTPPGFRLADQAAFHRDRGAFGPRTEHVLIQTGLNDEWGTPGINAVGTATRCVFNVIDGCDFNAVGQGRAQDPAAITADAYAGRTKQVVDYIKYYAPHAKISFVGYPTFLAPGDRTCVSVLGAPLEQPRDQVVPALLNNLNEAQRGAAAQLGINFIDLKTPSADHGSCTPQPWVGGILDPASGFAGFPVHLNPAGENVVAGIVKGQM